MRRCSFDILTPRSNQVTENKLISGQKSICANVRNVTGWQMPICEMASRYARIMQWHAWLKQRKLIFDKNQVNLGINWAVYSICCKIYDLRLNRNSNRILLPQCHHFCSLIMFFISQLMIYKFLLVWSLQCSVPKRPPGAQFILSIR